MNKNIRKWLLNQIAKAKVAWTIIVTICALFGYSLTLEKKIDNTEVINTVKQSTLDIETILEKQEKVLLKELQRRLTLIEQEPKPKSEPTNGNGSYEKLLDEFLKKVDLPTQEKEK